MINELVSKLKDRHYVDLTAKGKLVCPDCGAPATDAPDAGASTMRCARCRTTALLEEWSKAGRHGLMVGDADSPPPDTRIVRSKNGSVTTWHIPAGGKGGCFLLFAGIWLFLTTFVGVPMIFGFIIDPTKRQGDIPGWAIIPFLSLFWIIGLGILYLGLRAQFAQHLLTVDGEAVTLRRELFGRVSEKVITLGEVVMVAQKEFYQQNYKPVFGIEIKGKRSKIRFGSTLEDEERAWLVADLWRVVEGEHLSAPSLGSVSGAAPAGRLSSFSFPLPVLWVKALPAACFMVGISMTMAYFGWYLIDGAGDRVFALLWVAIWGAVSCGGFWMIVKCLRSRHQEIRLDGNDMEVSIRVIKHGRIHCERVFPRSAVTAVRSSRIGPGEDQKSVVLIVAGQSEQIADMVDSLVAADFIKQANEALGLDGR